MLQRRHAHGFVLVVVNRRELTGIVAQLLLALLWRHKLLHALLTQRIKRRGVALCLGLFHLGQ